MCGGVRSIAARSFCGVSPLRTAAVIFTGDKRVDLAPRHGQVLVDVGRQRLERRDVDDPHLVRQAALLQPLAQELVDRGQEGGERLARAGRRRDERVIAPADGVPAVELRFRGFGKAAGPPLAEDRMKVWG